MVARPIIFSAPMIRALLDGRKTQTRRLLTRRNTLFDGGRWPNYMHDDQFHWDRAWVDEGPSPMGNAGPYLKLPVTNIEMIDGGTGETVHRLYPVVQPGDRLYVREAWSAMMDGGWTIANARSRMYNEKIVYRADSNAYEGGDGWWPSIHMPREFSRLTLTVTDVRVQRLQDISRGDAMGEGCPFANMADGPDPRGWFRDLWNSLHGPDAWDANPWVVALTFTVHKCNIDQMGADQ